MAEFRDPNYQRDDEIVYVRRRSSFGLILGSIVVLLIVIAVVLFATGFWSVDMKGGAMPKVTVTKNGSMPDVTLKSKEIYVGTTKQTVEVPTVGVKDSDGSKDSGNK